MLPKILEHTYSIEFTDNLELDIAEKEKEHFTTGLSIEEIVPFDKELSKQSKWI